jgi:hypothetical protein
VDTEELVSINSSWTTGEEFGRDITIANNDELWTDHHATLVGSALASGVPH